MGKNYDFFFQNNFNLRRPRATNFAGIIRIATTFTKTTLKDFKKVKSINIKMQSISAFLDLTKIADLC